jgi:hypothetical protein
MNLFHPQLDEFFENWHRPEEKITCQSGNVNDNNLISIMLKSEPDNFRCLPVSWSLMLMLSSMSFVELSVRDNFMLRNKERWFPFLSCPDGRMVMNLEIGEHHIV